MMLVRIFLVAMAGLLAGCTNTLKLKLDYSPQPDVISALTSRTFSIDVKDERPYVVHGKKYPFYLGRAFGGGGFPIDVVSKKKVPLAAQMKADLREELLSIGLSESPTPARKLTARIHEWKFDTGAMCRFWYDIELTVADGAGQPIAVSHIKEEKRFEGNPFNVLSVLKKEMPPLYAAVIQELVRDNAETLTALQMDRH